MKEYKGANARHRFPIVPMFMGKFNFPTLATSTSAIFRMRSPLAAHDLEKFSLGKRSEPQQRSLTDSKDSRLSSSTCTAL
jgi:hypothetical protein